MGATLRTYDDVLAELDAIASRCQRPAVAERAPKRRRRFPRYPVAGTVGALIVAVLISAAGTSRAAQRAAPSPAATADIPADMLKRYRSAAANCPGLAWEVLAGVGKVETDHARFVRTSSAGAEGPMQFLPETWADYGMDGDGDGAADIHDPDDAVVAAAAYLCTFGAGDQSRLRDALWHYNHADWYVDLVLEFAGAYAGQESPLP